MNVFNEKTVAALENHGFKETATFVRDVTKLWNCLNVKSKDAGRNLNDANREPFKSLEDERYTFIQEMADKFKEMDTSLSQYDARVMCLTGDTSNALVVTLEGLIALIKLLLSKGFKYVTEWQARRWVWSVSTVSWWMFLYFVTANNEQLIVAKTEVVWQARNRI